MLAARILCSGCLVMVRVVQRRTTTSQQRSALAVLLMLRIARLTRSIMTKSEQEWQAKLTPAQFRVLRQNGTEPPGTGEYINTPQDKSLIYKCVGCDSPLYKASTQFNAHCGWPAFYEAIPGSITTKTDSTLGMVREEMRCANCDGHLGHIFRGEGYNTPTDARHCVNSICLKLDK